MLLTATPHAGDEPAFSRLCRTGALNDSPILMFRRSRHDAGLQVDRRVARLTVTLSPDERRMHAVLARYTRAAWTGAAHGPRADALLALVVLNKRALSSARSLHASVTRRLQLLGDPSSEWQQPGFRFDEDGETDADDEAPAALGCPALVDGARERKYLMVLAAVAARAARHESKLAALQRLLRRVDEPAIVFTEFRDTLAHVADALAAERVAVLHGGLTRRDRLAAERAFVSGEARVLLATDAAGEGLNLQARCRLVVNLELPWNPRRLEQRVGRVDRIGQRRTVHALHLVARDTGETRVLARLALRLEQARTALRSGGGDNAGLSERELLGAMVRHREIDEASGPRPEAFVATVTDPAAPLFRQISCRAEARQEVRRLEGLRRIAAGAVPAARLPSHAIARQVSALDRAASMSVTDRGRLGGLCEGPGLLAIYRLRIVTRAGRPVEDLLLPLQCPLARLPGGGFSRDWQRLLRALLARHGPSIDTVAAARAAERVEAVRAGCRQRLAPVVDRERLIAAHADALAALSAGLIQQGLFDRRAVHDAARRAQQGVHDRETAAARLAALEAGTSVQLAAAPELALVLLLTGVRTRVTGHDAEGGAR